MSVCKRDIAVIKGAVREESLSTDSCVVNGVGGDGRGVEDVSPVLRERVANVRDRTDLIQGSSLDNDSRGRNGKDRSAHISIELKDAAREQTEGKVDADITLGKGPLYVLQLSCMCARTNYGGLT
jgi:hypothetical protein